MARDGDEVEELPGGFLRVAGGDDEDDEDAGVPEGGIPVRGEGGANGGGSSDSELAALRSEVATLRGELRRAAAANEIAALEAGGDEPMTRRDAAAVYRALCADLDAREARYGELARQHYRRGRDEVAGVFREVLNGDLDADGEEEGEIVNGKDTGRKAGKGKDAGGKAGKGTRLGRKRGRLYRDGTTGEIYMWGRASEDDVVPDDGELVEPA